MVAVNIHDNMSPEQKFREHVKAYGSLDKVLAERIAANMELARKANQPHMRTYYVKVARLQNRMIVGNRRALTRMSLGEELPPLPPRRPYIAKRPGERSSPRTHLDEAREAFAETGMTPIPAICAKGHEWIDGNGNGAIRAPSLKNCRCFHCGSKLKPHPDYPREPNPLTPLAVALSDLGNALVEPLRPVVANLDNMIDGKQYEKKSLF